MLKNLTETVELKSEELYLNLTKDTEAAALLKEEQGKHYNV